MKLFVTIITLILSPFLLVAKPTAKPVAVEAPPSSITVNEIKCDWQLAQGQAKFTLSVNLDATGSGVSSFPLLEGEVALLTSKLPDHIRLLRETGRFNLAVDRAGHYQFTLDGVAKIDRQEPWNQVSFTGPATAIGSVSAQAEGTGTEIQLLTGTTRESVTQNGVTRILGFLGPERKVSLRWKSKTTEVTRQALLTCDTRVSVQVAPTVVKYKSDFEFSILQGSIQQLKVTLPGSQALTKLQGEGVRDWTAKPEGDHQTLTVELIRPVEKSYALTVFSEQSVEGSVARVAVTPPQPAAVERENGSITVSAEDVLATPEDTSGLRQANAPAGSLAAYQFYGRTFTLMLRLQRLEPVISTADRVTVRVDETRALVTHALTLTVEKAGIYVVEMAAPAGLVVSDVRGEGIEDWKVGKGKLTVNFNSRILGTRRLEVQLEGGRASVAGAPETQVWQVGVGALRVGGATKETAQIGASSIPGIQLKTLADKLTGCREISINRLASSAGDESLAYIADQPDWTVTLAAEHMAARITADVFNLITIGDGLLGGSATLRYSILNQGVQEFHVQVPSLWKNVEFTGPNIRRKELQGDTWVIGLQEKAWGGYTLVVTYDYQFDPHRATLPIGGIHAVKVERETGSVAITSAANLRLAAQPGGDTIRRVDESDLSANDRALITRPVLMAYKYQGPTYGLGVDVTRFDELPVLDAASDRTQLTTVLTEEGQMLSQASFMVKNNDRQFQTFTLPDGADFWGCYVDGQPAKPEKNGTSLLVPLPRHANRDEAFAVDIVYAQKIPSLKALTPHAMSLAAPLTDMQTTYAEWELYAPTSQHLGRFGGNMIVAHGTTYGLRDAWQAFLRFYDRLYRESAGLLWFSAMAAAFVLLILYSIRRGWRAFGITLMTLLVLALLASMLVPAMCCSRTVKRAEYPQQSMAPDRDGDSPAISKIERALDETDALRKGMKESLDKPAENKRGDATRELGGRARFGRADTPTKPSDAYGDFEAAKSASSALVSGLRPIRIDIPKSGTRFVFTKVLNVGKEPLTVRAVSMNQKVFNAARGILQALALLAGLALLGWQFRRSARSSFAITVALALTLGSIIHLLISLRLLDTTMIIAVPLVALAGLVWLGRKVWKRNPNTGDTGPGTPPPIPPVIPALLVTFLLAASAYAAPSGSVTILSATYNGSVKAIDGSVADRVVQIEAAFELESAAPDQAIRLFGPDVAVQEFTGAGEKGGWWFGSRDEGTAKLVRTGQNVDVRLSQAGKASVKMKLLVKLGGDVAKRQIAFDIPPALISRLSVVLDEPGAMVELPAAVSFTSGPVGDQQTRVDAVLGSTAHVELLWTPRMKRAEEIATTVFCRNTSLVSLGGGVINVRSILDYQVTQGELRQLQIRIPAGQRLMRVEGDSIRTWKLEGQTLSVQLAKGMTPDYRLTLETEKTDVPGVTPGAQAVPPRIKIEIPHATDAKRETGLVALKTGEEFGLVIETQQDLQKVDVEEALRILGGKETSPPACAYRFLKPIFELAVTVAPLQPQLEALIRNHLTISPEQLGLRADVQVTIKRAGVFGVRVSLPDGYRVDRVEAGDTISQWQEKPAAAVGGRRLLELTLKERTLGVYRFTVYLARPQKALSKSVAVEGIGAPDVQKGTGYVTVSAEDGIQIKRESFGGLTEVPAATVPVLNTAPSLPASGVLAFKEIPGDRGATQAGWSLTVATELIDSWVRAEVMNTITLTETLATGRSVIRYDVANSPSREFRVRIPSSFRNVEVTGGSIRRKDYDPSTGEWRVELQNKVRGIYALTVTWELPWTVKDGALELMGVEAAGVERETGWLTILAPPGMKLDAKKLNSDLLKVDIRDLPEWAATTAAPDSGAVLVCRYLRPGYKLALAAQRFDEAEVLQALVDRIHLTTVVAEDGQMMTEMTLAIRNNARQYLEVNLPAGVQVWSAFVSGQPVRPSRRNGTVLLPMERSGGEATVEVVLTYVGNGTFPRKSGTVTLASPGLDVPLKNAQWDLYLPPDYQYGRFEGTMTRAVALTRATVAPVQQMFSMVDYAKAEERNKQARNEEVVNSLSNARSQLASGNANYSYQYFNRAKGKIGAQDKDGISDIKKLEKELNRSQALNLVAGQQGKVDMEDRTRNAETANLPISEIQQRTSSQASQYDERVAELQWAKVSQAQEIAATKILPLRVNLPKRGLCFTFNQVLQTEIGKPMTVEFKAVNQRTTGWPSRIAWLSLSLLILWGGVRITLRRNTVIP